MDFEDRLADSQKARKKPKDRERPPAAASRRRQCASLRLVGAADAAPAARAGMGASEAWLPPKP